MPSMDLKYLYAQKSPSELVYLDRYRDSAMITQIGSIKLAMQKKGRLTDDTINILTKSGIDVAYDEGRFFGKCNNFPLEILFVRDDDIPNLVDAGAADIGIVGKNIYDEFDCKSDILKELGFGRCTLAIAVPEVSNIQSIFDLSGKKVATSYQKSVENFFAKEKIDGVQIVPLSGSVEMAVKIGYADAIVDLTSTGSSLRQNELKFLHKISDSESVLIANRVALTDQNKYSTINRLLTRINGYLCAKSYKHIIFSISSEQREKINQLLSSAKLLNTSDTFDNTELIIVRAIINKLSVWDIVEELRESGAKDIVLYDIESIM
jgi:ATP phosphoribosyltransferase